MPIYTVQLKEDWGLDDPDGKPLDEFRKTRDIIESKVKELIKRVKNNEINLN